MNIVDTDDPPAPWQVAVWRYKAAVFDIRQFYEELRDIPGPSKLQIVPIVLTNEFEAAEIYFERETAKAIDWQRFTGRSGDHHE